MASKSEVIFTDLDQYLFGHSTHYDLYKKLGAHLTTRDGVAGVYFAVWAPNAKSISVVGDFNGWDVKACPMEKNWDIGVWDAFVPGAEMGQNYKYRLIDMNGKEVYKADPYATYSQVRPENASRIWEIKANKWSDKKWMADRAKKNPDEQPMAIYECHIGSWMKHPVSEEDGDGFYTYREFADAIIPYLKKMHYTHIELLGISEHPFDGSWGYQVTGYYAPTSRYGSPDDFQYLINELHRNKIAIILDWVPAHFPKDEFGLAMFDGSALYEHEDPRQGEHPEWGTKIFNYGRPEVKNFLLASALNWIENYHIDGLRVDAVASMLYLDYCRKDGEWVANKYGENKNLEAIELFRHLNSLILGRNPGTVMIAEESTAWPMVTGDVQKGSLGFSYKWNMGWMNDFLEYMKLDPYFRKNNHNKMTFAMSYAYSEKYVLVLSHDEVVHLKCSMWSKMPGIYEDKYHNLRAAYTFLVGHPGKKLLFMGQEFGQKREWSETRELDWFLLEDTLNQQLQDYTADLWKLYSKYQALYGMDNDPAGFEWINPDDADRSIFSFVRKGKDGKNLVFVLNMTPMERTDYCVGVPENTTYKLILNSMDPKYGGNSYIRKKAYKATAEPCDRCQYRIAYPLPANGCAIFEYQAGSGKVEKKVEAPKAAKKTAGKT
ncbi:MAG: 1,4-alpha-glucan branching protein GlgB, partial [Lachnospiraceae bacterium]|nr:1,4-alpha-glucan branching protein GlgB [Candidatus Equihabitans merdae]